jgi:hypothetical protein
MLYLTRYANALFLFFVAAAAIVVAGGALLSTKDAASKLGAVIGAAAFGVALAVPYFFSYRATKSNDEQDIRRAMVASTVLLALSGLSILFGLVTDAALAFAGFVWGLPALFAVNTFKKRPARTSTARGER